GLQATSNNKIFIGKALFNDLDMLTAQLITLKETLQTGTNEDVKAMLKTIVPTFIEADYDQELYEQEQ
ncbi:MAG: hypothetical protein ACRC17_10045, partial [Culicoidibacterales bacterium]